MSRILDSRENKKIIPKITTNKTMKKELIEGSAYCIEFTVGKMSAHTDKVTTDGRGGKYWPEAKGHEEFITGIFERPKGLGLSSITLSSSFLSFRRKLSPKELQEEKTKAEKNPSYLSKTTVLCSIPRNAIINISSI